MTLVANVVIAPIFLKEVVSKRDVLSTMLIVAGCAVAVAFATVAILTALPTVYSS